jgi:hypothetical protein
MQAALRPMNLGEILDRTFAIYREKFLLFVGIAALPAAVMLGIHLADVAWWHVNSLVHPFRQPGILLWGFAVSLGYYHVSGFLQLLFLPAFVRLASCEVFGESATIIGSLRFALARWRSYLWLAFLKYAAVLIVPEALAFGVLFGIGTLEDKLGLLNDAPGAFAIVTLLLPIPAGIFLFLWAGACLSLVFPAAAIEQLRGFRALGRSWRLSRNSRWRIFIAWLLIATCSGIMSVVVAYILRLVVYLCYYEWHLLWFNRILYQQLTYVFFAAISILIGPLYPIAVTLFYYDQRSRKEGFDVEIMMEAAGLGTREPGAIRLLHGGSADLEEAKEPLWTQIAKSIRSLRGFD